jgi:hypothetical protein
MSPEASAQRRHIGQSSGMEIGIEYVGQLDLAGALVRELP